MRIYLAGPWKDRDRMPELAQVIETYGHEITRRWWYEEAADDDHTELKRHAWLDYVCVTHCDALVVINSRVSEGKAVETGIALALGKPVYVVGDRTNIFNHLWPTYASVLHVMEAMIDGDR